VSLDFAKSAAGWTGSIGIPPSGARGLPLKDIQFDAGRVRFTLPEGAGEFVFDAVLTGGKITGEVSRAGQVSLFALERANQ
jgi:hypothetical protein